MKQKCDWFAVYSFFCIRDNKVKTLFNSAYFVMYFFFFFQINHELWNLSILIQSGEQMCILIRISAKSMFRFFVRSVSNGFGDGVVHSDYNVARVQKACCKYIKNNETVIGQSEITINMHRVHYDRYCSWIVYGILFLFLFGYPFRSGTLLYSVIRNDSLRPVFQLIYVYSNSYIYIYGFEKDVNVHCAVHSDLTYFSIITCAAHCSQALVKSQHQWTLRLMFGWLEHFFHHWRPELIRWFSIEVKIL